MRTKKGDDEKRYIQRYPRIASQIETFADLKKTVRGLVVFSVSNVDEEPPAFRSILRCFDVGSLQDTSEYTPLALQTTFRNDSRQFVRVRVISVSFCCSTPSTYAKFN